MKMNFLPFLLILVTTPHIGFSMNEKYPGMIDEKKEIEIVEKPDPIECPICFEEYEKEIFIKTPCNHEFCPFCLYCHLRQTNKELVTISDLLVKKQQIELCCPLCRGTDGLTQQFQKELFDKICKQLPVVPLETRINHLFELPSDILEQTFKQMPKEQQCISFIRASVEVKEIILDTHPIKTWPAVIAMLEPKEQTIFIKGLKPARRFFLLTDPLERKNLFAKQLQSNIQACSIILGNWEVVQEKERCEYAKMYCETSAESHASFHRTLYKQNLHLSPEEIPLIWKNCIIFSKYEISPIGLANFLLRRDIIDRHDLLNEFLTKRTVSTENQREILLETIPLLDPGEAPQFLLKLCELGKFEVDDFIRLFSVLKKQYGPCLYKNLFKTVRMYVYRILLKSPMVSLAQSQTILPLLCEDDELCLFLLKRSDIIQADKTKLSLLENDDKKSLLSYTKKLLAAILFSSAAKYIDQSVWNDDILSIFSQKEILKLHKNLCDIGYKHLDYFMRSLDRKRLLLCAKKDIGLSTTLSFFCELLLLEKDPYEQRKMVKNIPSECIQEIFSDNYANLRKWLTPEETNLLKMQLLVRQLPSDLVKIIAPNLSVSEFSEQLLAFVTGITSKQIPQKRLFEEENKIQPKTSPEDKKNKGLNKGLIVTSKTTSPTSKQPESASKKFSNFSIAGLGGEPI